MGKLEGFSEIQVINVKFKRVLQGVTSVDCWIPDVGDVLGRLGQLGVVMALAVSDSCVSDTCV